MPYVSLYRKYRSQTFEDVIGQEHVTKTLQNAIRLGKVAHAYLFCGARGTGKTSTARLLAKAMNCDEGPTPTPCNKCPSCLAVTEGSAMDIIELDAASHRSIRDIDEIRENVKFPPMELRYKVFIIDEAHQLSGDAKDAFLKTLEEPPAHVIFILATTEPQSIPATIRSRCQQFDFRRGSLKDIRKRLDQVAAGEKAQASDDALDIIAMNADGSWRDALSIMEQVLAYTDAGITVDDVHAVLGTTTQDFLFGVADIIASGDEEKAFASASELIESGKDIQQTLRLLALHFRNLLFSKITNSAADLTTSKEIADLLKKQSGEFTRRNLIDLVETFSEAERDIRYSDHHRLVFEMALLKAINSCRAQETRQPVAEKELPVEKEKPAPEKKPEKTLEPVKQTEQNLPEFDTIKKGWSKVLQQLKGISIPAAALLNDATPVGIKKGSLVLQFQGEGQKNLLENETARGSGLSKRQALQTAFERVFGHKDLSIICEVGYSDPDELPETAEEEEDLPDPFSADSLNNNEEGILKDVLDIFPGKIVDS